VGGGAPGLAGQIGDVSGAVVDERAQHHVDPVEIAEPVANGTGPHPSDPLHDVAIGGEVGVVDGDHPSAGNEIERGVDRLEDRDRRRLVDRALAGPGTEQRGQLVADGEGEVQPVVFPPRGDQVVRPVLDHPVQGRDRPFRGAPE
jgi:hypothetical protein